MMLKDAVPGDVVTSSEWGGDVYVVIDCSHWSALEEHTNRVYLMCLSRFRLMQDHVDTEVTIVNLEEMK